MQKCDLINDKWFGWTFLPFLFLFLILWGDRKTIFNGNYELNLYWKFVRNKTSWNLWLKGEILSWALFTKKKKKWMQFWAPKEIVRSIWFSMMYRLVGIMDKSLFWTWKRCASVLFFYSIIYLAAFAPLHPPSPLFISLYYIKIILIYWTNSISSLLVWIQLLGWPTFNWDPWKEGQHSAFSIDSGNGFLIWLLFIIKKCTQCLCKDF